MEKLDQIHRNVQVLMQLGTARNPSTEFDVDALTDRAIEIRDRVEAKFKSKVPPPKMRNLSDVMQ